MFRTVLVANRGEIALRVARTCREMGVRVVAVYSTEDRDSQFVRLADEAVAIGPAPARRSYMYAPAILEAARRTGADAIHPGYGFLSEDPHFAAACAAEGLTFIGPPGSVVAALGDKTRARKVLSAAGMPLLPGSLEPLTDPATAQRVADEIGYPVIIKAAMGGGGRGMRIVHHANDFGQAYRETRGQAQALFGDGRVYIEQYLAISRHVEIQILADTYGNVIHLGERDCTVQRRHQKLIEETPAPSLPRDVVERMGRAAVEGARAAGYVGAGTFEFLVDESGDFHFLEVNCRIQVEHPVTEMTTGVDLVSQQLRISSGEPLNLGTVEHRGAAIECRINAEDPARGFTPAPGVLTEFVPPGGPFVRVDTAAFQGSWVSPAYDSLIAKLIVWGPDREQAIARMARALGEFRIDGPGITTTVNFLSDMVNSSSFRMGTHTTSALTTDTEARTAQSV